MQFHRRRPRVKHGQVVRLEMVVAHRSIKFWSLFRVVFPVTSQCVILLVVVNRNCIFGFEIKFQVYFVKKQIKPKVPMNIIVMIFPTSFDHDKRSLQFFSIFTLFWEKRTETKIMSHMRECAMRCYLFSGNQFDVETMSTRERIVLQPSFL